MAIDHDGVLKESRRFDVVAGEMQTILGCLEYLLEKSVGMSPNATPKQDGGELADDSDSDIDIRNDNLSEPEPESESESESDSE